ncbi:MAG: restriction endonuclease subunit S, partial [Anaerolineae bacterium]
MQTDLLFDQFDALLTTPDDVARLEAAVLQLAVQGKLVPQDPDDEPATELLKRIRVEKERLVREGEICKTKRLPLIKDAEIPYELPASWMWVRLPEIYRDWGQKKPDEDFTYIDVSAINKELGVIGDALQVISPEDAPSRARKIVKRGTVIYSTVRPYLLNIAIVDKDFAPPPIVSTAFAVMYPLGGVVNKYLYYYLRSQPFIDFVESQMTGMAYPAINDSKLRFGLFPLPPLAEQKRIVAKVDELLAQTRDLAAQLEQADAALVPAAQAAFQSLLEAQDTTTQGQARRRAAWQRIADHFDTLTSDPRTIEALKQTVLQLAVQGKLVPQDPDDEPASGIVKRAKEEKARLVKEKKVRKERNLTPIEGDELPYQTSKGWEWMRLGNLVRLIDYRGKTPKKTESGMPLITAKNVRMGYLSEEPREYVDPSIYESWMTRGIPRKGDVLFTTEAPLGNVTLLNTDSKVVFAQRIITFQAYGGMDSAFLKYALMSKSIRDMIYSKATGTTARGIKASRLKTVVIPIPPLAEQKRIVAKV